MKNCIYVVEDNAHIRDIIEFLLTEEDYSVMACPNVRSFWQLMQKNLPQMVVLDVMLPDGNGLEICEKLKQSYKTHDIPVMLMSANNYLSRVKTKCEADDFINKPFDINDFISRIEKHVHA
ncbi:MAG: response regulator [Pedobacter sp.]|nr:MAG: response regulator [Pedobacter sp.]